MVKCKRCPIKIECNKNPIMLKIPTKWKGKKPIAFKKEKVCPFIILLGNLSSRLVPKIAVAPSIENKRSSRG